MSFKRKSDLKQHIVRRHEKKEELVMNLLEEGKIQIKKNKWYMYPQQFRIDNLIQRRIEHGETNGVSVKTDQWYW